MLKSCLPVAILFVAKGVARWSQVGVVYHVCGCGYFYCASFIMFSFLQLLSWIALIGELILGVFSLGEVLYILHY